jgi:hypothetical protein
LIRASDVGWGARQGIVVGAVLGLFAAVVIMARGGLPPDAPVPAMVVIASYPVFGLIGGLIVGAFRSRLSSRTQATGIVTVAVFPFVVASLHVGQEPISYWAASEWLLAGAAALVLASIGVITFSD